MKNNSAGLIIRLLFFAAILGLVYWLISSAYSSSNQYQQGNYVSFIKTLEEGKVTSVRISQNDEIPTGSVVYITKDGQFSFEVSNVNDVVNILVSQEFENFSINEPESGVNVSTIIMMVIGGAVLLVLLFTLFRNSMGGGANAQMMNFGKSRAQMVRSSGKRFNDVAGLAEEKEELVEIVDFLKDPSKYVKMGARIPKGILLVGPPGTGKTLLAKAVAGEAGVPFFSISGSDFVEMFVGVGASRVRDLFADAKKNRPCIVFIDEIDAVARRRGTGLGGGHDEREQTLNQLLVEMDGFGVNSGIIVMAATNRVDILDPAIMRPGRFDRKVMVHRPDVKAREEILRVHSQNKQLGDDVDLKCVAQTTAGFTGADLENLLNESAILAAKNDAPFIKQEDVDRSFVKVGIGTEKKSILISEEDKRVTAYHEAGHAVLFHVLPDVGPVHTISIIPTGVGAAGYTMPLPEKDRMFMTKKEMLHNIMVSMGGRIAEEIVFGDITNGASSDIQHATGLAHDMVTRFGMSKRVGFISCGSDDEVFIGRDYGKTRAYSEHLAKLIDEEEKSIIDKCYKKAQKIILENRDILDACAQLLLEKEKIYQEEFETLWNEKRSPAAEEPVLPTAEEPEE
ncbi:MAG: ATP-dependent zinc metalloprotease FtsH [Lachnospiraceae bacterium]|nr:ATP-dependent zinc metalloprotease FtsH [Lachnospiraceae bacterium]